MTVLRHALTAGLAFLALVGCSSSMKTVEVPPPDRSVRVKPPDVQLGTIPPAPPPAAPTEPIRVTLYPEAAGPTLGLELLSVDRSSSKGRVVVQYQTGDSTRREVYDAPASGETLDIQPDLPPADSAGDTTATTRAAAQVRGAPASRDVEAKVTGATSWWERWWSSAVNGLAVVGGVALLALLARFVPSVSLVS